MPRIFGAMVLKVWFLDQQHQRHLGTWQKFRFLGTPSASGQRAAGVATGRLANSPPSPHDTGSHFWANTHNSMQVGLCGAHPPSLPLPTTLWGHTFNPEEVRQEGVTMGESSRAAQLCFSSFLPKRPWTTRSTGQSFQ